MSIGTCFKFQEKYLKSNSISDSFMEFLNTTDFICQSRDLQVSSNFPLDDLSQTCGREDQYYVYNGAFSNRSLTIAKNDSITFIIHVRKIEASATLFEFGMSSASVSRRDLIGSPSREYLGWVLNGLTTADSIV